MLRRAGFWRTEAAKFLMVDAEGGAGDRLGPVEAVVCSSALKLRNEVKVRRVVDAEIVWPTLNEALKWSSLRTSTRSARKQDVHIDVVAMLILCRYR